MPISTCCLASGAKSPTAKVRSLCWCWKKARRDSRSCVKKTRWACALRARQRSLSTTAACRAPICWAIPARASKSCSPRSTSRARVLPRTHSASRAPRSRMQLAISTSASSPDAKLSNSRAYNSCSPTWRLTSRCAKRGCGKWRAWSMRAPRISVSKRPCSRCAHRTLP